MLKNKEPPKERGGRGEKKICGAYLTKINWIIQNIPDEMLHFATNYQSVLSPHQLGIFVHARPALPMILRCHCSVYIFYFKI